MAAKGAVVVHAPGATLQGRIANIGQGGLLVITGFVPPEPSLTRVLEVELRLDGASAEWLRGTARLVRTSSDGFALEFVSPPALLARVLDELADVSHTRRRLLAVVLIDTDPVRRSAMATGFRAVGCAIVEAATPLEAIVRLGESSFEPDVIAIADSQPAASSEDLRAFTRQHHPHAKLVTIVDGRLASDALAGWVSADRDAELPQRIRDVLSRVLSP